MCFVNVCIFYKWSISEEYVQELYTYRHTVVVRQETVHHPLYDSGESETDFSVRRLQQERSVRGKHNDCVIDLLQNLVYYLHAKQILYLWLFLMDWSHIMILNVAHINIVQQSHQYGEYVEVDQSMFWMRLQFTK